MAVQMPRALLVPGAKRRPPVGFRRILVPLFDFPGSEVAVACRLAADRGATVTVVAVVEVPPELPLDAHMTHEEAHAKLLLARARATADSYGVDVVPLMLRARDAGEAIVAEARASEADLVLLRAHRRQRSRRRALPLGATVAFVLKHAPCRVMVAARPVA